MVIVWFKNKIDKVKIKIKQHFNVENLIFNLSNFLKINLITSIGIDEVYFGTKNPKRFKLCIFNCLINWFVFFYHFSFLTSDFIKSLIESPFLPDDFNVLIVLVIIALSAVSTIKTDILFGEINNNLNQLKIYYFLAKDIKSKHNLNEENYKKFVILFRIYFVILLYYGLPIASLVIILFPLILIIKTKRLFILFHWIFITPIYINVTIVLAGATIIGFCLISYYKMRYDQLHYKIKSIIPNGKWKFIIKRKGKLLLDLIDEHNDLAVEVHKLNMMLRCSFASMFIQVSLIKIVALHMIFNSKDIILKFFAFNMFVLYLVFGLAISYIFFTTN